MSLPLKIALLFVPSGAAAIAVWLTIYSLFVMGTSIEQRLRGTDSRRTFSFLDSTWLIGPMWPAAGISMFVALEHFCG
jgi:hypothetical protein